MVVWRYKTHHQCSSSAQYSGFKLATSTYLYLSSQFINHIKHALHFYISYVLFVNLNLPANYAMLMRPKKVKTAAYKI